MKKVEAIMKIDAPTTRKQLRSFIGIVNYYRDMWPQRSQLLAPLSYLTAAKAKWSWTTECQNAFDDMKRLIAMIAKEILLGQQIVVHTDHANPTYKHFNSDRVMRWRLFIEEYSPDLQYIKGENNVVADALSRLPQQCISCQDSLDSFYSIVECHKSDQKMTLPHDFHPLSYVHLETAQKRDPQLKKELLHKHKPCKYQ
jgi:hypothetical protein